MFIMMWKAKHKCRVVSIAVVHLLLYAGVVRGFGLLPQPTSPRLLPQPTSPRSCARSLCNSNGASSTVVTMMANSFWEGIVQGTAKPVAKDKCPVLVCPAQLSVPGDYKKMIAEFKERGFPASCADLTRVGWITGLVPSAFSPAYFKGELTPADTLKFYYDAIDRALEEIKKEYPGQGIHLVGHSIGGWVARAWLAEGCSPADRDNVLSLTTLGTPNTGPPEDAVGPWTIVDQTRGLLKNINARFPGAHVEGVRYTSVAGTALEGKFPGSVEEMLAFISYLPLCGDGGSRGDGIIPLDVAKLAGSNIVELSTSKHSGFVPFPGDAIELGEEFLWYGSASLMDEWVSNLDTAEQTRGSSNGSRQGAAKKFGGWPW